MSSPESGGVAPPVDRWTLQSVDSCTGELFWRFVDPEQDVGVKQQLRHQGGSPIDA